jgi:hypothetical protein
MRKITIDDEIQWEWKIEDTSDEEDIDRRCLVLYRKETNEYRRIEFSAADYPDGVGPGRVLDILQGNAVELRTMTRFT